MFCFYLFFLGENSSDKFVEMLVEDLTHLYKEVIEKPKDIPMLSIREDFHQRHSPCCHICKLNFKITDVRVRNHCHLTEMYRGPAHVHCNLNFRVPKFFPVLFHNFSGYDCHLFVKSLSNIQGDVSIIPLNKENYISLSKRIYLDAKNTFEIRFLDSNRFLQSSISSLAKNLSPDDLKLTKSVFQNVESFNLMQRKGVFPYDHLDSWDRFEETSLPPKSKFYNKMVDKECLDEEFNHALKVWSHFKCNTLKDYMVLYLKSDVLLLADIFESFRKLCISIYELDPCHYFTAPGLSWDAMLKTTKIKLELLTDIDMYNFFKSGIRGGLCQCSHRNSVANNKYMSSYNPNLSSEYLMYLDANNLYGWAMSQSLPYGNFQWDNPELYTTEYILNIKDDDVGYVLEVDLDYPSSIHDLHNDLPFCPENIVTPGCKIPKLIAHLNSKKKYTIHLKTLQQCISNGMVLSKVHRVMKFNQSNWLEKYISLNTDFRKKAKNKFEKDFFKLMNNSVYGKTMENVEKRKSVKIVSEWDPQRNQFSARKLIAHPSFHSVSVFTPNMCAIEMSKGSVTLDKPIYLGFAVLELSKWLMYDFHYEYMKPKFSDKIRLNYMDTDSFIYSIFTEDFYADIYDDVVNPERSRFDTSEYPIDNIHNFPLNNGKVLGLFKDENNSKIMTDFVGLRAKLYCFRVETGEVTKKAKGIRKYITNNLELRDYRNCLIKKQNIFKKMYIFRSKQHCIYTQMLNKKTLSCDDTKRYIREDGKSTYAWGHKNIP